MKCPECGKEMEAGYIHAGAPGLFWNYEEYSFSRGEPINTGLSSVDRVLAGTFLAAYRCQDCKLLIARYKVKKKKM
jgi:hypothetical protein